MDKEAGMRHRSMVTAFTLLVVLAMISCSLGSQVSTPAATAPPAISFDSDGDQVPDTMDICPLTPNPDQADTNANGIGDACDAPFLDGFAFPTPQGVVQSMMDERLRPAKIVAPGGMITFTWSEDARRLDLLVESSGEVQTFKLDIDLSDAALLASLTTDEVETGQDLSALRTWIAENPGQVQAVAGDEQPPPRVEPTPGSSLLIGNIFLAGAKIFKVQDPPPDDATSYVWVIMYLYFVAEKTLSDFRTQHPEEIGLMGAEYILVLQKNALLDLFRNQTENCLNACTSSCNVNCMSGGGEEGACFTDFPQISPCYNITARDCATLDGGVFYTGQTCPGACWISAGGLSACQETDEETCRLIPERSAGNPTTRFCSSQDCSKPICDP
jgi:hypothetical protein